MNPAISSKEKLLQTIYEVSFAMNDIVLYLDTHPEDEKALAYFHEREAVRLEALAAYAKCYGPLTIDSANDSASKSWDWVMQPWPWEKKGGCC